MIGDVKTMEGRTYLQTNREGTLRKLPPISFWGTFLIELKDCIKKWEEEELLEFCKKHPKRIRIKRRRRK